MLFCVDIIDNIFGKWIGKEFFVKYEYDGVWEISIWFWGRKFFMFILSLKEIFVDLVVGVEIWYSDINVYWVFNVNLVFILVYVLNFFLVYFVIKRYIFKEYNIL